MSISFFAEPAESACDENQSEVPAAEYEFALVVFIDILGFSELVGRSSGAEVAAIYRTLDAFRSQSSKRNPRHMLSGKEVSCPVKSFFFSDSVVRVTPVPSSGSPYSALDARVPIGIELVELTQMQYELARSGVFIRGGLTLGDIVADEDHNVLFGPALVRAYELESQLAVFPRIVVDPCLEGFARSGIQFPGASYLHADGALYLGDDGLYSLAYAGPAWAFSALSEEMREIQRKEAQGRHPERSNASVEDFFLREFARMDALRTMLEEKMVQFKDQERVLLKYAWVAQRFNETVSRLHELSQFFSPDLSSGLDLSYCLIRPGVVSIQETFPRIPSDDELMAAWSRMARARSTGTEEALPL